MLKNNDCMLLIPANTAREAATSAFRMDARIAIKPLIVIAHNVDVANTAITNATNNRDGKKNASGLACATCNVIQEQRGTQNAVYSQSQNWPSTTSKVQSDLIFRRPRIQVHFHRGDAALHGSNVAHAIVNDPRLQKHT